MGPTTKSQEDVTGTVIVDFIQKMPRIHANIVLMSVVIVMHLTTVLTVNISLRSRMIGTMMAKVTASCVALNCPIALGDVTMAGGVQNGRRVTTVKKVEVVLKSAILNTGKTQRGPLLVKNVTLRV